MQRVHPTEYQITLFSSVRSASWSHLKLSRVTCFVSPLHVSRLHSSSTAYSSKAGHTAHLSSSSSRNQSCLIRLLPQLKNLNKVCATTGHTARGRAIQVADTSLCPPVAAAAKVRWWCWKRFKLGRNLITTFGPIRFKFLFGASSSLLLPLLLPPLFIFLLSLLCAALCFVFHILPLSSPPHSPYATNFAYTWSNLRREAARVYDSWLRRRLRQRQRQR